MHLTNGTTSPSETETPLTVNHPTAPEAVTDPAPFAGGGLQLASGQLWDATVGTWLQDAGTDFPDSRILLEVDAAGDVAGHGQILLNPSEARELAYSLITMAAAVEHAGTAEAA